MKKNILILTIGVAVTAMVYTACTNSEAKKGVGISLANFDTTVSPTKDFFHYANGGWLKENPIPNDQVRWGSFSILNENNKKNLQIGRAHV